MYQLATLNRSEFPNLPNSLIGLAKDFEFSTILDSHSRPPYSFPSAYSEYEIIAGYGTKHTQQITAANPFDLNKLDDQLSDWYMGYLGYDLKNHFEALSSHNADEMEWPELFLFQPELLILSKQNTVNILLKENYSKPANLIQRLKTVITPPKYKTLSGMQPRLSQKKYLEQVNKIMAHIHRGDIYEMNFCMEFYNWEQLDPYSTYIQLSQKTPTPYSAFLKYSDKFLLSFSPERFLRKQGNKVISQPIKGTSPRGETSIENFKKINALKNNLKERTENIMITDLVRNDLSRIAEQNSVQVEELCGVYTYPHVLQMISTISADVKAKNFWEILRATFPMGSMTGAPKIKAMQLIENYEYTKRGIYSGAVGYIAPGLNFDFNVVIRSLQYHAEKHYLSYLAGSAITAQAVPEKEYEECLLKAYAINPELYNLKHAWKI